MAAGRVVQGAIRTILFYGTGIEWTTDRESDHGWCGPPRRG